jgi:hypothetical protein
MPTTTRPQPRSLAEGGAKSPFGSDQIPCKPVTSALTSL